MKSNIKKVAFYTLGCKLNFSESSTIARQFEDNGFIRVSHKDKADIYVINSCSVTESADKKCRNIIRKLSTSNPNAIVAVTGCYAQLKADEIASIEGVDIVVGSNEKGELIRYIKEMGAKGKGVIHTCETEQITSFFNAFSIGDRTRSFLKVQDGCSYHCAYCTIPLARGESRSTTIENIISEAKEIASKGVKEIVLTGVNIGDFGRNSNENFYELIVALDNVEGIERYRISSIEPNLLTDEIMEFCANSKRFQPHYHIPLQSGSDKILHLMRRRYNTNLFRERVEKLRKYNPKTFIGIDVIVGFPGEGDDEFEECYKLLEELKPSYLHIFPYSERPNTDAVSFKGKVSSTTKGERVKRLEALCKELHYRFSLSTIGDQYNVLIEGREKGGYMHGYTDNYIKVLVPFNKECIGKIVRVKILSVSEDGIAKAEIL